MSGITINEAHPLHGRSKCPICGGKGTVFSTAANPYSRRIVTCGLCRGRKWVFIRQFEPNCDLCRQQQQHQHEYHTKQGLLNDC